MTVSEILVVVGVIGLIVLITLPALGERHRGYMVRAAANDLVADLRVARHVAITERTQNDFTVNDSGDSPANQYTYTRANGDTRTVEMPDIVSISSAPALAVTFIQDGGLDGSAASIVLETQVNEERTDQFTISVSKKCP